MPRRRGGGVFGDRQFVAGRCATTALPRCMPSRLCGACLILWISRAFWRTRERESAHLSHLRLPSVVSQQPDSGTGAQILDSIECVFANMENGTAKARLGHVCLVSACNTLIGSGLECKEGRTVSVSCFVDALLAILNPFQVILFVFNYRGS